jgi:hypothetical protein
MSPIPPNKELDKNFESSINGNNNGDSIQVNVPAELQDEDYELINETNGENTQNEYTPIPQNQSESHLNQDNDDDDDDDEDDEDESASEIDPEEGFEMLASSRAFNQPGANERNNTSLDRNQYLFETDVFERKNTLECEDIQLDEAKSSQINSLMANFKLPDSAVPQWAKLVPEDVWKKNLIDSLSAKKTDLFDLEKNS